jgi:hypothetical protein
VLIVASTQATIVGTTSAVASLVSEAITLIQQIKKARKRINGTSTALENLSTRLDTISASLAPVQREPLLQEPAVEQQVKAIVNIHKELKLFFDQLEAAQQKGNAIRLLRALKDGDNDDITLAGILERLTAARGELVVRISTVHVGLTGNLKDGFTVARDVVTEINANVRRVLGAQLVLAERLQTRQLVTTCESDFFLPHYRRNPKTDPASGLVQLEDPGIEALGLGGQEFEQQVQQSDIVVSESANLKWHKNETGDDAGVVAGNLGYGALENQSLAPSRAIVTESKFGKGLRFIGGHVGPNGAPDFFTRG